MSKIPDDNVFRYLSPEPMPHIPEGISAPIDLRTAREIERDRVIDKLVADGLAPLKPGEPIPDTSTTVKP